MSRIVFFVSSMQGGGAERVAALLCNRWAANGHEVVLVPTFSGRGTCIYHLDEKVRLIYLADRIGDTRKTPLNLARRLWEMRRLIREFRADAVLSFLTHVNIATLMATRGMGIPVVVSERTFPPSMPLSSIWTHLRKLTYPLAQQVVMQTSQGLEWLKRDLRRCSGAVIANPCIFPLTEHEPKLNPHTVIPAGINLILGVGRLGEEKQFDLLISAFSKIAPDYPNWKLAIVGEGDERIALEAQISNLGLEGFVYLPSIAGNLDDWYNRAEIFAMTSRFEGFPNALLEALSYGLPAISFDCATGPAEMVKNGVNGFLLSPNEGVEGLAQCMARLMSDDSLRESMAQNATRHREKYSLDKVGAEWDAALGI